MYQFTLVDPKAATPTGGIPVITSGTATDANGLYKAITPPMPEGDPWKIQTVAMHLARMDKELLRSGQAFASISYQNGLRLDIVSPVGAVQPAASRRS